MSKPSTLTPVRARSAHAPIVTRTLAAAFHDDPVLTWVVPDAGRRRVALPGVFEAFVEIYLPHGETHLAGDGAAAALWAPAGVPPMSEQQEQWFADRQVDILGDATERAFALNALLEQHHPDQPCWYLQFMGVTPQQQSRGLGSRLLATVLQRCDADGAPAYLEATSLHNRRLYQRHGFATRGEIRIPDGPSLWPMWRAPQVPATRP